MKIDELLKALRCNEAPEYEDDGIGCSNIKCKYRDVDGACDIVSMCKDAARHIESLRNELLCILERAKPHAKERPQNITHLRTNARDACTWIVSDIEGFLSK